jgi:threonine dehydratase
MAEALSEEHLRSVHADLADLVRRTPTLTSASMSARCGGTVAFKAECLQRTGSFKLRGALAKLRALGDATDGVVAASAGNHGQSLAYAARRQGVRCEVYMPRGAPISKVEAVRAFGATVHEEGASVDECLVLAQARARESGMTFVHPFDDLDVIAGQAGVGIELAEDVADLRKVVLPIGGGGLAAGIGAALAHLLPGVEIVGVRAAQRDTIADGIAVKHPGEVTSPLIERHLEAVVSVGEQAIAEAMTVLLERAKLLVEGAGAAALAALLSGEVAPATDGLTVVILSGGNVDIGRLAGIVAHEETRAGRRARILTRVPDRPGSLAALLAAVAKAGANLLSVEHVRDGVPLDVGETAIALTVETRGPGHLEQMKGELEAAGYRFTQEG